MKIKHPRISVEKRVSDLYLQTGEMLTVWLQVSKDKRIQVELRINFDGEPEIFVDENIARPFKYWKSIYDDY